MRTRLPPVLALLLLALAARAEEPRSAADATERGRELGTALDLLLVPPTPVDGRVVWLLVDPTPSLGAARFAEELEDVLARGAARLEGTRIGVAGAGADGAPALAPTKDTAAVVAAVRELLAGARDDFRDVYADVRRLAGAFAGAAGPREIVLVTLENGDAENDLEATAAALSRGGVRLSAIAREAFLSDTYWIPRESTAPRGFEMGGGESAFVEVPWGWLFQTEVANEAVPSGFPMFGISRLAAGTDGKVFTFYPAAPGPTPCTRYGSCPFCRSDHVGCREAYQSHRLRAAAPPGGSRREALAAAARDPWLLSVLDLWGRAAKEGLLRSRPSVSPSGGTLRPERRQLGSAAALGDSLNFGSQATRADRLVADCDRLLAAYERELGRIGPGDGSDRYRAIAELARVELLVTRMNLILFAGFCREAGPALLASYGEGGLEPPEYDSYQEDYRFTGIGWTTMPLCHGVAPFAELRLPGGEVVDRELAALAPVVEGFLARHAGTPFAEAVRRTGLARFHLAGRGLVTPPPDRNVTGSSTDETGTSAKERPGRAGGGGTGGGGVSSGGDR